MARKLCDAGKNEVLDTRRIVEAIQSKSEVGNRLLTAFHEDFGVTPTDARLVSGSTRRNHHDMEMFVGKEWKNVEIKNSQKYKEIQMKYPWKSGVQFYNGSCSKFGMAKKYARLWYDDNLASGRFSTTWRVEAPIPSFDEWYKDCCVQGNPTTAFGKELKEKVRAAGANLRGARKNVVEHLDMTEEEKKGLIHEVGEIVRSVLLEKHYWLVIHGNIMDKFYVKWFSQYSIPEIQDVVLKKGKDVEFTFQCTGGFEFHGILRWGKGAGFSCLRMDLK